MSEILTDKEKLLIAFRSAVKAYKPWHSPLAWNSNIQADPFPKIVDGAHKLGFLNASIAMEHFEVTGNDYERWREGAIPERRLRKKVWSFLKKECGLN